MYRDHCRSCNAPIIWTMTIKNRQMPVDAEPSNEGNITLEEQGAQRPILAVYHSVRVPSLQYHTSHFATCPDRKKWRKHDGIA